jgi:hypothetical protein
VGNRRALAAAAAIAGAVLGVAVAGGAPALEDRGPRPRAGEAAPREARFGPAGVERAHDCRGRDCCGLEAKLFTSRFSAAIRLKQGLVHPVAVVEGPGRAPHPAVAGRALLRLRPGAAIEDVAAALGAEVARAVPALSIYALARPGADPAALAAEAARDPRVAGASPDWIARCAATFPNDELYPLQRGARAIGIEQAWSVSRGRGVTVAVLDTGFDGSHRDLQGALADFVDIVNAGSGGPGVRPGPYDDNGHGTAIAGIIAARFQNGLGTAGIAPEASVLAIKVADRNGNAAFSDLIAGIDEAVRRGARIVNISLGAWVDDAALAIAIDRAAAAGALVVAAAGNENVAAPAWPAAYPGVFAVGGASDGGEIAFTTVLAPGLAILAPSENVLAPLPGGVTGYIRGTSAAAAHAAGVAALVLAKSPGLDRTALAQAVRYSARPVASLAAASETFPFGSIDAHRAVERADPAYVDVAVSGLTPLPSEPKIGETPVFRIRVENQGSRPVARLVVKGRFYQPGSALAIEFGASEMRDLAPGETRAADIAWTSNRPEMPGRVDVEAAIDPLAGETETADNSLRLPVIFGTSPLRDVRVARFLARPDPAARAVALEASVQNLGTETERAVDLLFFANGSPIGLRQLGDLAPAAESRVSFSWPFPPGRVPERVAFEAVLLPRAGETRTDDNGALAEVRLGIAGARPLSVLYEQSNGVDIISDTPFRVAEGRDYVPLMIFVPSKGDPDPNTYLDFAKVQIFSRDDPAPGPSTLLYEDATGSPVATAAAGIVAIDENMNLLPALDIFQDQPLYLNGRHMIFRLPRAAIGVPASPAASVKKYFDVRLHWEFHRKILWIFNVTRDGWTKKVLEVSFGPALPALPLDGHYYDVHHHTIAEWFFSSPINVFAPRKAYGGPIAMTAESACAVGMTDSPSAVRDLIVTTDHNCFYNEQAGNPNDRDHRPPWGPSSPAQSIGASGAVTPEHARYREIFGVSAGEEVAIEQDQTVTISGLALQIPLGAHIVSFRGEHVEGPWHGGGWIPDPGSPNIDVPLDGFIRQWATQNQAANANAFCYAAHPFSSMLGFSRANLELAFGLDPAQRALDYVHASPPGFVFKGLQLWNGRTDRSMSSSAIDFDDLNPFLDPMWRAGNRDWDRELQKGLIFWHGAVSDLMAYAFTADPDAVFVRKVFIAAGSDAHGDYDYSIQRLATPVTLQETFSVTTDPYACARTYVFADRASGATPGERYMQAFSAGRSVLTDGPLLLFSMDAEGRFDGTKLQWHDRRSAPEDEDGRIGGGGAFDGEGTMLVVAGAPEVWFRYRYENAWDMGSSQGAIQAIKIYKDEAGGRPSTRVRPSGGALAREPRDGRAGRVARREGRPRRGGARDAPLGVLARRVHWRRPGGRAARDRGAALPHQPRLGAPRRGRHPGLGAGGGGRDRARRAPGDLRLPRLDGAGPPCGRGEAARCERRLDGLLLCGRAALGNVVGARRDAECAAHARQHEEDRRLGRRLPRRRDEDVRHLLPRPAEGFPRERAQQGRDDVLGPPQGRRLCELPDPRRRALARRRRGRRVRLRRGAGRRARGAIVLRAACGGDGDDRVLAQRAKRPIRIAKDVEGRAAKLRLSLKAGSLPLRRLLDELAATASIACKREREAIATDRESSPAARIRESPRA